MIEWINRMAERFESPEEPDLDRWGVVILGVVLFFMVMLAMSGRW